jgi:hypothetical protein
MSKIVDLINITEVQAFCKEHYAQSYITPEKVTPDYVDA